MLFLFAAWYVDQLTTFERAQEVKRLMVAAPREVKGNLLRRSWERRPVSGYSLLGRLSKSECDRAGSHLAEMVAQRPTALHCLKGIPAPLQRGNGRGRSLPAEGARCQRRALAARPRQKPQQSAGGDRLCEGRVAVSCGHPPITLKPGPREGFGPRPSVQRQLPSSPSSRAKRFSQGLGCLASLLGD